MTIIVIADTVKHARKIVNGLAAPDGFATSPRSILHYGAGRGLANVTKILVDDSAWPLDSDVLRELAPHHAPIHSIDVRWAQGRRTNPKTLASAMTPTSITSRSSKVFIPRG